MAIFNYRAKRGLIDVVDGSIDADDQTHAIAKIEHLGLFPVTVTLAAGPKLVDAPVAAKPARRRKGISSQEVLYFVKKLTTLTRAQVELLSSLRVLHEQTENGAFKDMILSIYNTTKEGKTFSYALEQYPKVFSNLFVSIIKAGEASGRLDTSLEHISDFMAREEGLKNKVKVALAYPMLLCVVGITSVFILLNFVVPKLKPLLEGMGNDLPVVTRMVLGLSVFVNKTWIAGLLILLAAGVWLYQQKGSSSFYLILRKAAEMIPVVRRLGKNQELTQFTQALALLLKSGIPALTAFEIALHTVEDPVMREGLSKACRHIAAGESVSRALKAHTKLPDFFIKMIAIGEESGRLVVVLDEIAHSCREQIELDISVVAALLEPVLILVLGLVMGGIVLSILLPTFQISQFIR